MNLQGFYTDIGQALAAKIAAGTAPLAVTRVVAGSGHTEDIPSAASLPDIRQTLTVGEAQVSGTTATLPVTLAEAQAEQSYQLTELGVYAADPAEGEVLFQIYQLSSAVAITAGGESVLRFYLRQTIGAQGVRVTCSPAGLLVEEDLTPMREKVFALSVPARSVSVEADELQAYLDAMPRMLTERLTINVGSGTINGLTINGLFGSGYLVINGGGHLTVSCPSEDTRASISCCTAQIVLNGITFHAAAQSGNPYTSFIIATCPRATLGTCSFTGSGLGILEISHSRAFFTGCSINNYHTATYSRHASVVAHHNVSASGNSYGVEVEMGGIVLLSGSTPDLLGGSSHRKWGGIIAKSSGTLL